MLFQKRISVLSLLVLTLVLGMSAQAADKDSRIIKIRSTKDAVSKLRSIFDLNKTYGNRLIGQGCVVESSYDSANKMVSVKIASNDGQKDMSIDLAQSTVEGGDTFTGYESKKTYRLERMTLKPLNVTEAHEAGVSSGSTRVDLVVKEKRTDNAGGSEEKVTTLVLYSSGPGKVEHVFVGTEKSEQNCILQ